MIATRLFKIAEIDQIPIWLTGYIEILFIDWTTSSNELLVIARFEN